MSSIFESTDRFLRPNDVGSIRRNQRQIRVQTVFVWMGNALVAAALVLGALWVVDEARSSGRFAVRHIEIVGAAHTAKADLDRVTAQYAGLNLFKIDIARVQRDLGGLAWVSRIAIEKNIPDTLRIRIVERKPVALVLDGRCTGRTSAPCTLRYVDESGSAFADLSPRVGDDDLPLISGAASAEELARSVAMLAELRRTSPEIYSRVSEVHPLAPAAFAFFDRQLGTYVYASRDSLDRWKELSEIAGVEGYAKGSIEYADLRFAGRVIVKPVNAVSLAPAAVTTATAQITN